MVEQKEEVAECPEYMEPGLVTARNIYVLSVVHWYVIEVRTKLGGELVEKLQWRDLRWELRCKYSWYFRYRATLLQVKYPKYRVDSAWGNEPAQGKTAEQILKDKIRAKKAKITEVKNKIEKAKQAWDQLFPIEDYSLYQKAVEKLGRLEAELECLEQQAKKFNYINYGTKFQRS